MEVSTDDLRELRRPGALDRTVRIAALVLAGALVGSLGTAVAIPARGAKLGPFAAPEPCSRDSFPGEALRVVDGDTFEARLDLGMQTYRVTHIRLAGIDTPEVHGPIAKRDLVRGPEATEFTRRWLAARDNRFEALVHGKDKYGGRVDATIYPRGGGQSLSEALRQAGHAK